MALWTAASTVVAVDNGQHAHASDGNQTVWYARCGGGSVFVAKSVDEGSTFGAEITVATAVTIPLDQPFVYDPITGRLHLIYALQVDEVALPAQIVYVYSDNRGATWSAPQTLDDGSTHANNTFVRVALSARNGVVVLLYVYEGSVSFLTDGLFQRRSTTGGTSGGWSAASTPFSALTTNPIRPFTADDGTYLHAVWVDTGAAAGSSGGNIYYARSADYGSSWPRTLQLTSDANGTRPVVSAAVSGVNIAFMDPAGIGINSDIWACHSDDWGSSFGPLTLIATHVGSAGDSHPYLVQAAGAVYLAWQQLGSTPPNISGVVSTTGGSSYGPVQTFVNNVGDIPFLVLTSGMVLAYTGNAAFTDIIQARNPAFLPVPNQNRVLDNATRANAGPPPSASWSGGDIIADNTPADGLVVLSNKLTASTSGAFRQGSYWNSKFGSPDHEAWYKVGALPSVASDGASVYVRLQRPGVAASVHGYSLEWFNDGSNWSILRWDNSVTSPALVTFSPPTLAVGDIIALQAYGSRIIAWYLGATATDWLLLGNAVSTTYTADGNVGVDIMNGQTVRLSSFGGGVLYSAAAGQSPTHHLGRGAGW